MKTFNYNCVTIQDVADKYYLDFGIVMDAICASDISFGTNYDTLMHINTLETILEDNDIQINIEDFPKDTLIALGS